MRKRRMSKEVPEDFHNRKVLHSLDIPCRSVEITDDNAPSSMGTLVIKLSPQF